MKLLKFPNGNLKLAPNIFTFSLPSGKTCPGALKCLSRAIQTSEGWRIKDGPFCEYRCHTAIDEVLKPAVRLARQHNFDLLKGKTRDEMIELIEASLPRPNWNFLIRVGVAGDYFNQAYFDAWLNVAKNHPDTIIYSYTKSIPFWLARRHKLPDNFRLTASWGGRYDDLIIPNRLRSVKVVMSEKQAEFLGLELDHDDSHAYNGIEGPKGNFAILLHGTQPAGSPAAVAWQALKKIGKAGYSRPGGGGIFNNAYKKKNAGGTPYPVGGLSWFRMRMIEKRNPVFAWQIKTLC